MTLAWVKWELIASEISACENSSIPVGGVSDSGLKEKYCDPPLWRTAKDYDIIRVPVCRRKKYVWRVG